MDYEKAYKEALKRAKSKIKNNKDHVLYEDDIIEMFPELKESEDEKIRKRIILSLKHGDILNLEEITEAISWLEKQGEQKPAWSEDDKEFLRRAIKATKDVYPMTAKWLELLKQRLKGE